MGTKLDWSDNQFGYMKVDWSDPTKPWDFHAVSEKRRWGGHRGGVGDINGDGCLDLVGPLGCTGSRIVRGSGGRVPFEPHPINNESGLGVQVVATDIDRGGRPDILAAARKGPFVFFNKPNG